MLRKSTLPAARAALTMTLTTGFCMAYSASVKAVEGDCGGKEHTGAKAGPRSLPLQHE
jgi:hypothetical protein